MERSLHVAVLAGVLLMGTACSQSLSFKGSGVEQRSSAPDPGAAAVCQPGTALVSKPTKFILVVDQSGSNFDGPFEHPGMATDPQKVLRGGSISEFLALYGGQDNIAWSFITFNGVDAQALTFAGDNQHPVFTGATQMNAALDTFKATTDQGNTPYLAALEMVRGLIRDDLSAAAPDTLYRIVFMTDGYPTDTVLTGAALDAAVDSAVTGLVGLKPTNIEFSTVYYGLPDALASSRLQNIATEGGGEFLDVSQAGALHLNNAVQVPVTICN